jgi:outer membrane protein
MHSMHEGIVVPRRLAIALVVSSLLSGCSFDRARSSVDLTLPSQTTAQFPTGQPVATPAQALTTPGQPVATPTQSATIAPASYEMGPTGPSERNPVVPLLSLPEAVNIGLRNNPRLYSALAAIESARGRESAAFSPFLPQIDLFNRYVTTNKAILPGSPGPTGVINIPRVGPYDAYQGELQLQWILYDFGRTAGKYNQARIREQIAQSQSERARETVAYDVATAYLQALEAVAFRRIAVETIRRAEAVLEDVRSRQVGGVAVKDDVLRGEVQLSESRDSLVRAEDDEITALAQLNNALGRNGSTPLKLAEVAYPEKFTASLPECLLRAATQRPEVAIARDRVAVAQFGRQAAKGELLPELDMKGSLGRIDGLNVVGGFSEGVAFQLNIPLYHGGAPRGNLRAAEADISQALADSQNILNGISMEVTIAYRGVISAQTRVELARPAVDQSAEALRIVRERYRNGTATPTDVISAEAANTRSEQRFTSARLDYLISLARLAYSIGDGLDPAR